VAAARHLVAILHVAALCKHAPAAIGRQGKAAQADLTTVLHMVLNLNGDGREHAFIPLAFVAVLNTVSPDMHVLHQ
jgi:hypothetical protein